MCIRDRLWGLQPARRECREYTIFYSQGEEERFCHARLLDVAGAGPDVRVPVLAVLRITDGCAARGHPPDAVAGPSLCANLRARDAQGLSLIHI